MIPAELKASIDLFAGARDRFAEVEELAVTLCATAELAPARGALVLAHVAIHTARLAVLEAVEQARRALEPRGKGGGWGGG